MSDFIKSFVSYQQWWTLALFDIKQRYRRSTLGPLWITLSTGIMVVALGFLWSSLFKMNIKDFLPFFAVGLVFWTFISAQLNEACTTFVQFEGYIKQINLPLPLYVLRVWSRNLILLAHNMLVFIFVWIFFKFSWIPILPMAILGFTVVAAIIFFLSIPLGIVCTRFRDISQIVQSLIQILYFFTPIIWQPKILDEKHQWVLDFNPLYHLFEIIRAPLLGQTASKESWLWSLAILLLSAGFAIAMHSRYRKRVAYWL